MFGENFELSGAVKKKLKKARKTKKSEYLDSESK